jgi:penicillin-binding protein 1C
LLVYFSSVSVSWLKKRRKIILLLVFLGLLYITLVPRCRFKDPFSTVITDRDGMLLGARVAIDGQWRFPPAGSVPEKLKLATIAFEDRYFMYHPGINPVSIFRALIMNIKEGRIVSGGSTLSMQTVRLYRKGKPRKIPEKLLEMLMATRLEFENSKNRVLALYISHAPYGGNVVGADAAAWRYFGTSSDRLSWAEAATLAILPNSPALVHPGRNRKVLIEKRDRLLKRLYDLNWIDKTTYETSIAERIPEAPNPMPLLAGHLLNRVYNENPGTLQHTTVELSLQQEVSRIIELHHKRLQSNEIHNLAAIVLEVESGNIAAYVGNCGYPFERNHGNDVDIIQAHRSTGSLLKPLLFAAMIDDGKILPESLIPDIPINLGGFSPRNFNGQFEGAVPATLALSRSLNVPAVEMLKAYGTERFHHLLKSLGMTSLNKPAEHYGLSLILGGAEGTLEDISAIYASMSRVLKHTGKSGSYFCNEYRPAAYKVDNLQILAKEAVQPEIFNASSIWSTFNAMIEVNRPEEETGWQNFGSSRSIAWKTGTSFGYRDGWAIGVSSAYVVGVWAGNADGEGRPGLTGISAAAPVMFAIFGLLPEAQGFIKPLDELIPAAICPLSGYLAGFDCPVSVMDEIPVSGLKTPVCPFHKLIHLSADLQYRVTADCYPVDSINHIAWFVLPPVQEWYYRKRHIDYKPLPRYRADCDPQGYRSMDLVYPAEKVKIFVPTELKGEKGRVVFEAVHRNPDAVIYWHLDNDFVAETRYMHQVELLPGAGTHRITIVDGNGEELVRSFEVVEP